MLVRQLEQLGYTVIETENAVAALSLLDTRAEIDLLLTDVTSPEAASTAASWRASSSNVGRAARCC